MPNPVKEPTYDATCIIYVRSTKAKYNTRVFEVCRLYMYFSNPNVGLDNWRILERPFESLSESRYVRTQGKINFCDVGNY